MTRPSNLEKNTNLHIKASILKLLLTGIIVLVSVFLLSVFWMYWKQDRVEHDQLMKTVQKYIPAQKKHEAMILESVLKPIALVEHYQTLFLSGDRGRLLEAAHPLYQHLLENHRITHFYFHGLDRVNFLRVHRPEKYGGAIDRVTLIQAERTGKTAYGIELGALGTLTLRVVIPWEQQGQRIGYLELGKEISHLLDEPFKALHLNFYTFTFKRYLQRESWEQGMATMKRPADWDRFSNVALLGGTNMTPPLGMDAFIAGKKKNTKELFEIFDTENFHIFFRLPIQDMRGRDVGLLIVTFDETNRRSVTQTHIVVVFLACLVVTILLVFFHDNILGKVEQLYESIPLGYQSLDADGRIVDVNKMWEKILGYEQHELIGQPFSMLLTDESKEQFSENFRTLKQQGKGAFLELEMVRKDGNRRFVSFESGVGYDKQGKFQQTHCILSDVTERKRLEEQLIKSKERAEETNRAKSNFLATMSHEIRTPLNTVVGINEHLLDIEDNPGRRRYLELAKKGGENLLALLNDILDLSKIEANQLMLEKTSFNLPDIIHKTAKIVDYQSREKGVGVFVNIASDIPENVIGDPQRLTQILLNLEGNAIKFTEMGKVTVEVKRGDKDAIQFTVSDTGIGIPKEKLARIFDPFTQADDSTTRRFGGTGLGLDICRRLVSLMDGRIWVESIVGKGSQFHFTYPLPEEGAVPHTVDRRIYRRKGMDKPVRPMQILMAEDVEENATVIQAFLSATPHHLDVAENGAQAVERFRSGKYDLVLMDVQMPVMDGFTATQKIRSWEKEQELPYTPILALTAHALQDVAAKILESGCDMHMTKPVSKNRLLGILQYFSEIDKRYVKKSQDLKPVPTPGPTKGHDQGDDQGHDQGTDRTGTIHLQRAQNTEHDASSLNASTFETLCKSLGGNHGPIKQFIKNLPQRIADISGAVSEQSPAQLGIVSHKLKGTARMFGAERLASMSYKLEVMGKNGTFPEDGTLLDDLKSEALNVEKKISAYLHVSSQS